MSNFIPMVSASPPPLDDHSFGYDDDDDFGTFTGADDSHESSPGPPEPMVEPDWEDKTTDENIKNNNPEIHHSSDPNINDNSNKLHPEEITKSETLVNGTEESDEFAHFEQYETHQKTDVPPKKPHIENLPIQSVSDNSTESNGEIDTHVSESKDLPKEKSGPSPDNGSCDFKSPTCDKETVQSSVTGSRDSTTDSGMFSTDISPVPKSEDTAELCDRSCDSDNDDTFPDLPKDKTESTDSLPVSETESLKPRDDSPGVESDSRTSTVLESCSNVDECVSEASKDDSSSVSQTKVEEGDTTLNKDDQSMSCSSTDQQVSPLHSRDDSQFLSEQNGKSSQDVSVGQVETNGQDEDDWGDFDSAGSAAEDDEDKDVTQDITKELNSHDDNGVSSGASDEYAEVQSEEDCLEAIDEALKDSENGVTDLGDSDKLDFEVVSDGEEDKSKGDCSADIGAARNSTENPVKEQPSQADEESCDKEPEHRTDSGSDTELTQDNLCAKETSDPPQDTQEDKSVEFVAEDEEWNAFGEFSESGGDGGENWADFQDFEAPSSDTPQEPSRDQSKKFQVDGDEEDEDFGDFNTAKQESSTDAGETSGGFAPVSDKDNWDDDEDWAEFDETSSVPVQTSQIPTKPATSDHFSSYSHSKVPEEKLEKILSSCFPSSDVRDAEHSFPSQLEVLIAAQPNQGTVSMHISKRLSPRGPGVVWGALQDLDKTSALVYQWSSSAANGHMFKTLHIDTQNILFGHKKQSVPIFASNIGLLEPIRGSADARPLQPRPNPRLVDPDKADDHTGASQELPPVEFDWDNSGLTNPLTAEGIVKQSPVVGETPGPVISSSMSKTLDLDFLSVQETENVNKNTVFQSEILDAPRSSVKSLPPLEDILKNMKTTTTTRRRQDEHLSEEAGRIIDSLPLLSFMTSKVLMFPLRQANE